MENAELRVMQDPAVAAAFGVLTERLSGSDLRALLRAVAATRSHAAEPQVVLNQQRTDRFCEASPIDAVSIATISGKALQLTEEAMFDAVQLSPMGPLGGASAFGVVAQDNVVTTMQLGEIVSDPTNALALLAAARRRLLRDTAQVTRLSAVQRVVRAKQFDAPSSLAHFSVLGLVSAGLDRGKRRFELEELSKQLRVLLDVIDHAQPDGRIEIHVSDNSGRRNEAEALADALADRADTEVGPPQSDRRPCYPNLRATVSLVQDGKKVELADCGVAKTPAEFKAEQKDLLVVSRVTIDRLIEVSPPRQPDSLVSGLRRLNGQRQLS